MKMKKLGRSITAMLLMATFVLSVVHQPALAEYYRTVKSQSLPSINILGQEADIINQGINVGSNNESGPVAGLWEASQNMSQEDKHENQNPAGLKSDRANFFIEEDDEDEIDLTISTKNIMESNHDNPLIYNILKKKRRLDLLDKFKAFSQDSKTQQEKTVIEPTYGDEISNSKKESVQEQVYNSDLAPNSETTEEENKDIVSSEQIDVTAEEELELTQELMSIMTLAGQDEEWYNTLIGPSTMNGVKENQYSAWANMGEIVSPQTGDLTLKFDDITLPGRNGLDLSIGRIYQSNQALLGDWRLSLLDNYHNDFSTYYQNRYNLGAGWAFTFPSVQVETYLGNFDSSGQTELYYHTGNGDIYHVDFTTDPNDSNLENYYKKDGVFKQDTSFSYMDGAGGYQEQVVSEYVFETANKTKQYFAEDGRLMAIIDRFGNQITFKHDLFPVTNRVTNYDFDDEEPVWFLDDGSELTYDSHENGYYYRYCTDTGRDDNTSIDFYNNSGEVTAGVFSKLIKVDSTAKTGCLTPMGVFNSKNCLEQIAQKVLFQLKIANLGERMLDCVNGNNLH